MILQKRFVRALRRLQISPFSQAARCDTDIRKRISAFGENVHFCVSKRRRTEKNSYNTLTVLNVTWSHYRAPTSLRKFGNKHLIPGCTSGRNFAQTSYPWMHVW